MTEPGYPSGGSGSGNGGSASSPFSSGSGPENPSGGSGGNGEGSASLPTITLTAPGVPTGPDGGSGGQGLTSNPAESGVVTVTVSNPGGYGGSPSAGSDTGNSDANQGTNAATGTDVPPLGGYGAGNPTVSLPTRTVTVPEGESGALPTNTFTSRAPWSAVPTSGWNASASGAGSTSTPCPDTTEAGPQVSIPPVSFPPPVSVPTALASEQASEQAPEPTGDSVVCDQTTTMTLASRTFTWCAQVDTIHGIDTSATGQEPSIFDAPTQTVFLTSPSDGGYAFSARDNVELPIPSTLSTIVVRSLGSVPSSSTASVEPAPSACGNHADVGDFTFNVSNEASPIEILRTVADIVISLMTFHPLADPVLTRTLDRCHCSAPIIDSTSRKDLASSPRLPHPMTHLLAISCFNSHQDRS